MRSPSTMRLVGLTSLCDSTGARSCAGGSARTRAIASSTNAGRGRALLDLDLAPPGVERLLLRGDLQHEGLAASVDLVHAGAGQAGGHARDGRRRAAE